MLRTEKADGINYCVFPLNLETADDAVELRRHTLQILRTGSDFGAAIGDLFRRGVYRSDFIGNLRGGRRALTDVLIDLLDTQ